ncbi:hypothetical protein JXA88_00485 [Candidatus Fermentibacteria bacterium]|nr:hypothetical protein [Candidatus Fermentibacteria bacterium]
MRDADERPSETARAATVAGGFPVTNHSTGTSSRHHDLFYRGSVLVLYTAVIVARARVGILSAPLKLAALAVFAAVLGVTSAAVRQFLRQHTGGLMVIRYLPLFLPLALALWDERFSLLPPLPMALITLVIVAVDSAIVTPGLAPWCIALASPFLLLVSLDGIQSMGTPDTVVSLNPEPFLARDDALGHRPVAGYAGRASMWKGSRQGYDVAVTADEFSRRVTVDRTPGPRLRHAAFMGCSFVFGQGVDDGETLPSHFASETRSFRVYNYGLGGWGPQHMYALLESGALADEISEHSGVMLYGLHAFHVDRAIGSYIFLKWGRFAPCYILKEAGLARAGSFAEARPASVRLVDLVQSSRTLDRLMTRLDLAFSYKEVLYYRRGVELTVAILSESAREYHRQFDGEFIVFLWPNRDPRSRALVRELTARGIRVIILADHGLNPPDDDMVVALDGHPNGSYYARVARILADLLDVRQEPNQ